MGSSPKKPQFLESANALADALDARVFVYSGAIDQDGFGRLVEAMQVTDEQPYRPNSAMLLTTQGGFADSAYRIARLMQNTSERFHLCIPARCKSAGTLVALGATDLIMSTVSDLGPLDVQLMQRDEIGQRRSGLVVRTALEGLADETFSVFERVMLGIKVGSGHSVSFEAASRIASSIATGVMAPVYAQINPDALGNDLRDLHVAKAYGERLVEHGMNATSDSVRQLVEGYPAHGFIIDRAEAESLFKKVSNPGKEFANLISALGPIVYAEQDPHVVMRLDCVLENDDAGPDEKGSEGKADSSSLDAGREAAGRSNPKGKRAEAKRKPKAPDADEEG